MLPSPLDRLLVLLLTLLFLGLWFTPAQDDHRPAPAKHAHRGPRPLRPRTLDDCPKCPDAKAAPPAATARSVVPYAQRKGRRGRSKTVDTHGQACPNPGYWLCPWWIIRAGSQKPLQGQETATAANLWAERSGLGRADGTRVG
jgi:hypothetical protein